MMARPFLTRPLRRLFSADTNVTPEAAFDGKVIIVDLPVQVFRLAGRMANLAWKYRFQIAVMRRQAPSDLDQYLRPVFLFADEAQNFTTDFDAEYQAVARAAGGCTVYLTQNRESYLRVLGSEAAVDFLLGNLQLKAFCQQSSPATNAWAARLLGERWQRFSRPMSAIPGAPRKSGTPRPTSTSASSGVISSNRRNSRSCGAAARPTSFRWKSRSISAATYSATACRTGASKSIRGRRVPRWTDDNIPVGNPIDRDFSGVIMMVMAGSLLVFLRRNIGVRLLIRRRFVIAAALLYGFSNIETPFDEPLTLFAVAVVLLVFIHRARHMMKIRRGVPEWHSYDTGQSLIFFFVPLPRFLCKASSRPALCGAIGWWLSERSNATFYLGWWITISAGLLFSLENTIRIARRESLFDMGDIVVGFPRTSHAGRSNSGISHREAVAAPSSSIPTSGARFFGGCAWQRSLPAREGSNDKRATPAAGSNGEPQQDAGAGEQQGRREEQSHWGNAAVGKMTVAQALEILGLNEGATEEEIRAAHKKLMQRVHPDVGGSNFFAKRQRTQRVTCSWSASSTEIMEAVSGKPGRFRFAQRAFTFMHWLLLIPLASFILEIKV